jgi:hypothetical protein
LALFFSLQAILAAFNWPSMAEKTIRRSQLGTWALVIPPEMMGGAFGTLPFSSNIIVGGASVALIV